MASREQQQAVQRRMMDALNKVSKWRSVLTGRILGTRSREDPRTQGMRDLIDKLLILRCETTALTGVLISHGVFTLEEFFEAVTTEAELLDQSYERLFPGITTSASGVHMDVALARETMAGWPEYTDFNLDPVVSVDGDTQRQP